MSSKKVFVNLTYTSSGAQPPIFLAGSFSEPAWEPREMECKKDENGKCYFNKEVEVDEGGLYQYKFRIGVGDWWVLNEQAPSVTDELGNRNNLLTVHTSEEIVEKSRSPEPAAAASVSDIPIPEVIVEKLDEEPRHGDDFGPDATTGQKDAHNMRALDAEPDHVVIRSQTTTPVYASTAAEVADSASLLDREPSPAPVSDEQAGRTGERRMSATPIPQVALTAAEVADIAAILDRDDEYSHSEMRMNLPHIHYPQDTPSGPITPWHGSAPLFAHELVGPHDTEVESPITSESLESPTKLEHEEEVIDMNDPTLERFPEDRMSILTHIRSCESRMSEDETNVQGVPPSPITRAKSRSPSLDTPGSARLDAQPSPVLDVITEDYQEDNYFNGLPGPTHELQNIEDFRQSEGLNVIHEAGEPADGPKIKETIANSDKMTTKDEVAKPTGDGIVPVDGVFLLIEHRMIDSDPKKTKDLAEQMDLLKSDASDNLLSSQPGPTVDEIQAKLGENRVRKDDNSDVKDVDPSDKVVSNASVHPPAYPLEPVQEAPNQIEQGQDNMNRSLGQLYSHDGVIPEVHNDPKNDFNEHVTIPDGQEDVKSGYAFTQNGKFYEAKPGNGEQKEVHLVRDIIPPPGDPNLLRFKAEHPQNENPHDSTNAIVPRHGSEGLQEHGNHLQPVEVDRVPVTRQVIQELAQKVELQKRGNALPEHVDGALMDGVLRKDSSVESTIEAPDVARVFNLEGSTADHDILERNAKQSATALEEPYTEVDTARGFDLPESKADEIVVAMEHNKPETESQVQGTFAELERLAVTKGNSQEGSVTNHESCLPVLPVKTDEALQVTEHEVQGSNIEIENASTEAVTSVMTFESPQGGLETTQATHLSVLPKDANEALMAPDPEPLGLALSKSAFHVDQPSANIESTDKIELPMSQMSANQLDSAVDKSVTVGNTHSEVEVTRGADLSLPQLTLDDAMQTAGHLMSGISDGNDVDDVDSALTNGVDAAKSTSVDASSQNGHNDNSKLGPTKATPSAIERQLTLDSIRSPTKASEAENKKSIWQWFGGILASLCGGERGPLLAISAVVILGPLLAMYFLQLDVL